MSILSKPNNCISIFPSLQITINKCEKFLRFKLLMIINYKMLFCLTN